ncbi:C39 family peptidase [Candidatus Gottesmanbacteria bacterium]|nr:C39 family peptidase [Candidatus Gottesmanbacteria bacterium]
MNNIRWLFFSFVLSFLLASPVNAQQVCQQQDPCASKPPEEKVTCYSTVVDTCKNARETLLTQINYMNNQIRLLTLNIQSTKGNIDKLSREIDEFGREINRLEVILNQRLQLILKRIPESYKRAVVSPFNLVLLSQNFSDLTNRVKYLMAVQGQDANLLFQVKATQNNYGERKQLRERKKEQFEQAKKELERQNIQLTQQKQEKDSLLTQTRGQEATYQQLLTEAKKQLASFASFADSQGASLLNNQTFCDGWGCYYNQRDSQWGNALINGRNDCNGPCSIARVGCLVTSLSMMVSHLGRRDISPVDIAFSGSANFSVGTAMLMRGNITVKGVNITRTSVGSKLNPGLLNNGPVIVGVYAGPFGTHFVVVKSYSNGNYIMNDPYVDGGRDKTFTDHYSLGSVFEVDRVSL